MNFGQRLTELRKAKKLSQEEVAEKINVSRQTVSKWETNQSTPDFDKIIPLCELFEISTDELITGKKDNKEYINEDKIMDTDFNKKKRTLGLIISIFLYFTSITWIMISIPVLMINPVVASAIFILICGIATCILIYSRIMYKKTIVKKELENKLYKSIKTIIGIIIFIIYILISFITMAWHITWLMWVIYGLIVEIVKLIFTLRGEENEK